MKKVQAYLASVVVELKKVTWPSWEELKGATWAVVVFSLLAAAYVFAVDNLLMRVITKVADLFGT